MIQVIKMSQESTKHGEILSGLRRSLHDLNNALTPIMANAQLARLMVEPSEGELGETLDDVIEASSRANALVAQMRQLARELEEALPPGEAPGSVADDEEVHHG